MINTILFDFDGTLINTNTVIIDSFQHTYRSILGKEKDVTEIVKYFGEPLHITLKRDMEGSVEDAVKIYRDYHYARFEDLIEIFEGMDHVIQRLHEEGYKLGLVTSRLMQTTLAGLNKFGLTKYFHTIITADDCERHKPDPEPLLKALEALKSKPEEAIMIGDTPFDIDASHRAGVLSVLVGWSMLKENMELLNPDFILEKAEDIFSIIRAHNLKDFQKR
ncbi:MAG: pyrophosphatase PpaX [Peptostreptococcales bacterium]|jgi:pyrophosphatase PpaX